MNIRNWLLIACVVLFAIGLEACARGSRGETTMVETTATASPKREVASAPEASTPLPPGFQQEMLAAHNRVRANASPKPSPPLPSMTWSPELAAKAQEWADTCPTGHRPDRKIQLQGQRRNMGENIGWRGSSSQSAAAVVDRWAAEALDYDYATNLCGKSRKSCYHYTQLVWRDSTLLGCGVRRGCTNRYPTVYVCNYFPAGNVNMPANKPY